jgi:hypothetical protein
MQGWCLPKDARMFQKSVLKTWLDQHNWTLYHGVAVSWETIVIWELTSVSSKMLPQSLPVSENPFLHNGCCRTKRF